MNDRKAPAAAPKTAPDMQQTQVARPAKTLRVRTGVKAGACPEGYTTIQVRGKTYCTPIG